MNRGDIAIIENGVDPVPADLPSLKPDGKTHLVVLSRLVPHKRIEQAIDTVRDLPGVVLDIVGSGWWEDQLRAYAADLGDRVIFHGHVGDDLKHALLARSDLHLMPSAKEGWGIAVIEAGQHGVPTIGYREAGGLRDSIADGETGLLVDSESEFRAAVRELVADPDRRTALGAAARHRASQYSWQETGRKFAALLSRVVGSFT